MIANNTEIATPWLLLLMLIAQVAIQYQSKDLGVSTQRVNMGNFYQRIFQTSMFIVSEIKRTGLANNMICIADHENLQKYFFQNT